MNFRFLVAQAAPYRRQLVLIGLLSVLGSLATLAVPWLAGQLIGGVLDAGSARLPHIVGLLVAALTALALLNIIAAILSAAAAARILADLRIRIHAHIQKLPLSFHDRSRQGDLLSLMTYEAGNLSAFLTGTLATAPSMLLTAGGAVILLFLIDPVIALFVPVMVPIFFIVLRLVGRRLRLIGRKRRKAETMLVITASSHLEMLPAAKAFAVEDLQDRDYARLAEQTRQLDMAQSRANAAIGPVIGLVAAIAAILILVTAGSDFGEGGKSPAELFSFLFYAALLTRPVGSLAEFYGRYQMARGTLSRMQAALRERPEGGRETAGRLERPAGAIEFERVTFAYPGRATVLRDASLAIAPGEIIAVTGENGAGKSTLVSLLLRFYEPTGGRIFIDGNDIAGLPVQEMRRQIGYVPQRALLFNGTVRQNIAYGMPDATDEQLDHAIRLAQASEFIAKLPRGLATEIGDHGVRLSGGQRQRIALARALISDPPILVLDEATSMYDMESEAAFVEACLTALHGRTVILITHRPASLKLADRIVSVRDGAIRPADQTVQPE